MAIYLITYTLHVEGQNYKNLHSYIGANYARVGTSAYAFASDQTVEKVRDDVKGILDANDYFYIFTIEKNPPGQGDSDVNSWLARNLR